jgi:DNA-binding SARP family transcriptional activator
MSLDDDLDLLTRERDANAPDRVVLLNGFELHCDGEPVDLPLTAQRLLGFLALEDRTVTRSHAAATLWLDSTDKHAAASLRSALWRLRRPGYPLVEVTHAHLRLAPWVRVDYRELRAAARGLVQDGEAGPRGLLDPQRLSGELLPDWLDDWVLLERERFRTCACTPSRRCADGSPVSAGTRRRSRPDSPPSRASRCGRAPTIS